MNIKTERNSRSMERRILRAFRAASVGGGTRSNKASAEFEHGQWWIVLKNSGQIFSVVDAEGGQSVDGFDFEEVAAGDEL